MQIYLNQKAIIYNQEGKILTLRASYKKFLWDLPGGGVEIPEEHEAGLRREIKEETGLEVKDIKPLEVHSAYNTAEDYYVVVICYSCTALQGEVVLSEEHTEYKWVTREEFLTLKAIPYQVDLVRNTSNKILNV